MTFIAGMAAVNYYRLFEFVFAKMWDALIPYADAMGLLLSFMVVFLLLQFIAFTFVEEHTQFNAAANAVGGAIFGGMAGMLLAGILAISWLMLPGSAYYLEKDTKEPPTVMFNVDEMFLATARFMGNDRIRGSVPFDPMHIFMKLYTNKYRGVAGIAIESPSSPQGPGNVGLSDEADLKRTDREP
jgi:hypothetical protein